MMSIRAQINRHSLYDALGIYITTQIIGIYIISFAAYIYKYLFLIIINHVLECLPQIILCL